MPGVLSDTGLTQLLEEEEETFDTTYTALALMSRFGT
jgi:hypothetical protein